MFELNIEGKETTHGVGCIWVRKDFNLDKHSLCSY